MPFPKSDIKPVLKHVSTMKRSEVIAEIVIALRDKNTPIFLDASFLIHFYEVSAGVREELLKVLTDFGDRVMVPVWAARETWVWANDRQPDSPMASLVSAVTKRLDEYTTHVRRYVDDGALVKNSKSPAGDLISKISETRNTFVETMRQITVTRRPTEISSELFPFINQRVLGSNVAEIIENIHGPAQSRVLAKFPPGFMDFRKGEAKNPSPDEEAAPKGNPYGDIIIWKEVLDYVRSAKSKTFIIVTRDVAKGDLAYLPRQMLDDDGNRRQEDVLYLPDPFLLHEARIRAGVDSFHICTLKGLAYLLATELKVPVPRITAALQVSAPQEVAALEKEIELDSKPLAGEVLGGKASRADQPLTLRAVDLKFVPTDTNKFDRLLVRLMQESSWSRQNAAVIEAAQLVYEANGNQLLHFGVAICRAARDGAVEAINVIEDLCGPTASIEAPASAWIILGTLVQIYLTPTAAAKKPLSNAQVTAAIFAGQERPWLKRSYELIFDKLRRRKEYYLLLPGEVPQKIQIKAEFGESDGTTSVLKVLRSNKVNLLDLSAPAQRRIRLADVGQWMITGKELKVLIGTEFVVRPDEIALNLQDDEEVKLPATAGFIKWGPETGVELR